VGILQPVHRLHAQAEQDVDRDSAFGERDQLGRGKGPDEAFGELLADDGLQGEGWALLQLGGAANGGIVAGGGCGARIGFKAGGDALLQLVGRDDLRGLQKARGVAIAQAYNVQQGLLVLRIAQRLAVADCVLV
jgi:hypothetical protein